MPFDRLKARIVGNHIRAWLIKTIGSVPPDIEPHIDPFAEFLVAEKEENPEIMNAYVTMVLSFLGVVRSQFDVAKATSVIVAAIEASPATATVREKVAAGLAAVLANESTILLNKALEPYEVTVLSFVVHQLGTVSAPIMMAYRGHATDGFDELYEAACAAN